MCIPQQPVSETTRMGDGIKSKTVSIHPCELLEAERKNLILSPKEGSWGFEGVPLGVLGYVPDLRSSFQKPSALGGKGVLSTSLSSVLASIVPGKEIWRFVVLRVVPEI